MHPITPLRAVLGYASAALVLLSPSSAHETSANITASFLWGPYRPNLYFGVRPRLPRTLLIGSMWARVDGDHIVANALRHTCEQSDSMAGYGWTAYEPRKGGSQTMHDTGNMLDLTTEFFKAPAGPYCGNWGVRVKGALRHGAPSDLKTTVILYLGIEKFVSNGKTMLECTCEREDSRPEGAVSCVGATPRLGSFTLDVHSTRGLRRGTFIHSIYVPNDQMWQAKQLFIDRLIGKANSYLWNASRRGDADPVVETSVSGNENMHFIQKVFEGPFELDVLYSSHSSPSLMTSENLTSGIHDTLASIAPRFDAIFAPQSPFNNDDYAEFSKNVLSDLLGGMGYFYGDSRVDLSYAPEYGETDLTFWEKAAEARARSKPASSGPTELLSFVPSRSFFPQGFLWDEGFHLRLVIDWDLDLALEIIRSWYSLMNDDGWIAREQILGPEARSKVPPEFQTQYPHYANPPTLFLAVTAIVDILSGKKAYAGHPSYYLRNPAAGQEGVSQLYALLNRQYDWFRRTQSGSMKTYYSGAEFAGLEGYRWKGQTPQHCLTSGLDDYPRAKIPHPGDLHADAISWVGAMAGALAEVASYLGRESERAAFTEQRGVIQASVEALHWSEAERAYCDASVKDGRLINVCHKGYVSLMPFLVGLLGTENSNLGAVLDLISDKTELWSPFGVRSLSKSDALYGTAKNYWRGPIWVNMNFLILERLLELAQTHGHYQQRARAIYSALRRALVATVFNSWRDTGFVWEQYNPQTGAGQRTRHFTGWTALIVKILAMQDFEDAHGRGPWLKPGQGGSSWAAMKNVIWIVLLGGLVVTLRRRLMRLWRRMAL